MVDTPQRMNLSRRTLHDEGDTQALAAELASVLPTGTLLLLVGPLGAGKTTLVRHLVAALDGPEAVTSPSYTLIHEYPTPQGTIVHIDAYRLSGVDALHELGLDEYLANARLVIVEWGEALAKAYPEAWILHLERPAGLGSERSAEIQRPEDAS